MRTTVSRVGLGNSGLGMLGYNLHLHFSEFFASCCNGARHHSHQANGHKCYACSSYASQPLQPATHNKHNHTYTHANTILYNTPTFYATWETAFQIPARLRTYTTDSRQLRTKQWCDWQQICASWETTLPTAPSRLYRLYCLIHIKNCLLYTSPSPRDA